MAAGERRIRPTLPVGGIEHSQREPQCVGGVVPEAGLVLLNPRRQCCLPVYDVERGTDAAKPSAGDHMGDGVFDHATARRYSAYTPTMTMSYRMVVVSAKCDAPRIRM